MHIKCSLKQLFLVHERRARRYYSKRRYTNKRRYSNRTRAAFNQNTYNTQTWLNQLGYNAGSADGISGRRTRNAIRQFQIANGMPSTGALSPQQTAVLSQQAATAVAGVAPATRFAGLPQAAAVAPVLGYQTQPQLVQPVQPQLVQPVQPAQPQLAQPAQPQAGAANGELKF